MYDDDLERVKVHINLFEKVEDVLRDSQKFDVIQIATIMGILYFGIEVLPDALEKCIGRLFLKEIK